MNNTTTSIDERMRALVEVKTDEHRRFRTLEDQTEIPHQTWKAWYHRRQRPTAEMIEAIAHLFPSQAFWMATGLTDCHFGHVGIDTKTKEVEILKFLHAWDTGKNELTIVYFQQLFKFFEEMANGRSIEIEEEHRLEQLLMNRLREAGEREELFKLLKKSRIAEEKA